MQSAACLAACLVRRPDQDPSAWRPPGLSQTPVRLLVPDEKGISVIAIGGFSAADSAGCSDADTLRVAARRAEGRELYDLELSFPV